MSNTEQTGKNPEFSTGLPLLEKKSKNVNFTTLPLLVIWRNNEKPNICSVLLGWVFGLPLSIFFHSDLFGFRSTDADLWKMCSVLLYSSSGAGGDIYYILAVIYCVLECMYCILAVIL